MAQISLTLGHCSLWIHTEGQFQGIFVHTCRTDYHRTGIPSLTVGQLTRILRWGRIDVEYCATFNDSFLFRDEKLPRTKCPLPILSLRRLRDRCSCQERTRLQFWREFRVRRLPPSEGVVDYLSVHVRTPVISIHG